MNHEDRSAPGYGTRQLTRFGDTIRHRIGRTDSLLDTEAVPGSSIRRLGKQGRESNRPAAIIHMMLAIRVPIRP